jgi:pyrimidine-nucleoside phosphorylase
LSSTLEFIRDKRDGRAHSAADIRAFVAGVASGSIPDYQITAWLMAAFLRGLDPRETLDLTLAMADSGEALDLTGMPRPVVDKHSTGGVGDSVTPILLPILAACEVPIVKMSGRGLGFTGGTLDKMAAIPGFRTDLSPAELIAIAREVGCALGGQTANLAPADKALYRLRDATETVGSIPLIAASVMSKKIAAGADKIVLDVKVGNGAFMGDVESARLLAETLVAIGKGAGRETVALLTDMNQPLGPAIGNALEIEAGIVELKSGCKGRLGEAVLALADELVEMAGSNASPRDAVESGRAIEKMKEWIAAQGGDASVVDDTPRLPRCARWETAQARRAGWLKAVRTSAIGEAARSLGAGRTRAEDEIDLAVGILCRKEIGDPVAAGEPMFAVCAPDEALAHEVGAVLEAACEIVDDPVQKTPVVIGRIG